VNERTEGGAFSSETAGGASGYAGRTRYTQLEYEAVLANASIGIAFTRERRFFLCNPRFAEMFGWKAEELIGQPGEVVYPSRESYEALGRIAVPVLSAGKRLDIEWELRRKDGTTFPCRIIAQGIGTPEAPQGTVWIAEDITERRRQSVELNRALAEQEAILNTVPVGISFERAGAIARCSRRLEQMYGYGEGELVGRPRALLCADEEGRAALAAAGGVLASGRTFSAELLARRKDGSVFWSRLFGRAVEPAEPERGSVWAEVDVTEPKQAEHELRRVLEEQRVLLENALVGIAFVRDGRVVRANRRFEEMFAYAPGESLGSRLRELYAADADAALADARAQTAAGRAYTSEQWLRRRDGGGFWCQISARAIGAGAAEGEVWIFEDVDARRRAHEEATRLAAEQQLILDNANVGILFVRDRVIQRCNRRLEEMVGAAPGELIGRSTRELFARAEDWEEAGRLAYTHTPPGGTHVAEWLFRRRDGATFLAHNRGRRIDCGEQAQLWIWSVEDVTVERQATERVRRALVEQDLILENATIGIAFVRHRVFQRCNPAFERMLGYEPGELIGKSTALAYVSEAAFRDEGETVYRVLGEGTTYVTERELRRRDGSTFWARVVGKAIDPAQPREGSIWCYDDTTAERAMREALERVVAERTAELRAANERLEAEIAERKAAEDRAQHLADHDPLTGLPNRRLLEDRLMQALALSQRNRKLSAVLFVDLDRFKTINDTLGHAVGDALLREIARRLVAQLRAGDTVCRVGGDEFIVVLPEIRRGADAAQVAQKLIETVSEPVVVDGRELYVAASVGIAVFPDDGRDAETLLRNADAAMYHAKEKGRANYQFFTEQMNQLAQRRLALEGELWRAARAGEFRLYAQAVYDAASRACTGHELLLRWHHPGGGVLQPEEFLPVAEDIGLLVRLAPVQLEAACGWARAQAGITSLNLSARQLAEPKLGETVERALAAAGVPAAAIECDVPEMALVQQPDVALAAIRRLRQAGARVAIDDFGAGTTNLGALRRAGVERVKIARALVEDCTRDADARTVIAALVALAHALGMRVLAKGVESAEQECLLRACGCDELQGACYGEPADTGLRVALAAGSGA